VIHGETPKNRPNRKSFQYQEIAMSDDENKRRIKDKALEHFLKFGFSKVTMNEIAEELGMSKKTIYQFFPSKEDLLSDVITMLHERTANDIETLISDQNIDFRQKLRGALDILTAFHSRMTPYILADMEKHAPDVCRANDEFKRQRIRNIWSRLVGEGIQKGIFRDDVDKELIVLIYAGALQHLLNHETFNRLGLSVSQIHRTIGTVVLEGILKRENGSSSLVESNEPHMESGKEVRSS
jgi:AcrR family transcriptional regulator